MYKLYVSNSGNDNNPGTIEQPVKTLEKAKELVKMLKKDSGITVFIRGGRYFFKESLTFDEGDSGTASCKISYRAYENETVYFDGGAVLDAKQAVPVKDEEIRNRIIDKSALNNILELDLSGVVSEFADYGTRGFRRPYVPAQNELFIDGESYDTARYPNKGEKEISLKTVLDSGSSPCDKEFDMRPATFVYEDSRCDLWGKAKNFYISGIFNWCFADDTMKIANIDTEAKTMTTELPHLPSMVARDYTSWYAVNLLEEIDVPGEYYVDRETKKVYFYPKKDITNSLIQISVLAEPMVVMENASFIEFDGIVFENARGTGVYIERGQNCAVRNSVFRNLGMVAVQIGRGATPLPEGRHTAHGEFDEGVNPPEGASRIIGSWHEMLYQYAAWNNEGGKNHGVVNCDIYNCGTGGIMLGGGDRKSLTPANNYVENCEIHDVNRLDQTYKAGINMSGVGNRIANCEIYDLPGFAIYLHGNDHIIEYNKIHDVVKNVADAGAIYMGRDLSEVGNVIRYNFIYNITGLDTEANGVCAVYFDDFCSFNAVYENYFYNIKQKKTISPFGVVFWNCGGQSSVNNNIFLDCTLALSPKDSGMRGVHKMLQSDALQYKRVATKDKDDFSGVDVTSEVYRRKYPYVYEMFMGTYRDNPVIWSNIIINGNYEPFKDIQNLDLTLIDDRLSVYQYRYVYDILMGIEEDIVSFHIVDFNKIGRK